MINLSFARAVMSVFAKHPALQLTIRELSKKADLSYNATHRTVQALTKEHILLQQKYGNVCILKVNNTAESINLLAGAAYHLARKQHGSVLQDTYHLPQEVRCIILLDNKKTAIVDTRKTDYLMGQTEKTQASEKIPLLTMQELLADLSKRNMQCDSITILRGAEYFYEKVLEIR